MDKPEFLNPDDMATWNYTWYIIYISMFLTCGYHVLCISDTFTCNMKNKWFKFKENITNLRYVFTTNNINLKNITIKMITSEVLAYHLSCCEVVM